MSRRHALRLLVLLLTLSACSQHDHHAVDRLNALSYAYHYRDIDSAEVAARQALQLSAHYADGRAEALNNLAFVDIIRMQYDEAAQRLEQVPRITSNQIERLVSYVQQMRLCVRRSSNREFYDYREKALQALRRIDEDRSSLSPRDEARLLYAESELAIVTSTYYYYVGLVRQSIQAIEDVSPDIERDTAQYLNYLYNIGSGGMIASGTQEEINQRELDFLAVCFQLSREANYPYFAANSLEALAEHFMDPQYRQQLISDNPRVMAMVNPEGIADDELALWLADNALVTFREYQDVYQIAGAYRTLASCYHADGDDESALYNLEEALSDSLIYQAPDLVASIYEQLSVVSSALNDKASSDDYRNRYLDLQEQTRQDRWLEARAGQVGGAVSQLNKLLIAVVVAIAILAVLLLTLYYRHRQRLPQQQVDHTMQEREEELQEQLALARLHVENGERRHLEQRAKISLVTSILPLIDRVIHEVRHLGDDGGTTAERLDYINELAGAINDQNDVLTHWIQLNKGELSLHVETFPLQAIFDIVGKSRTSFAMKGITLDVQSTNALVKADRVLTLFMLNTLADNARKFTPEGGQVRITAEEQPDYVEVSVSDTGCGMDEAQIERLLSRGYEGALTVTDHPATPVRTQSHGFGLLNCKGIIDKYRKTSRIFAVCTLGAESRVGQGSRFFFRLPRGVARLVITLAVLSLMPHVPAQAVSDASSSPATPFLYREGPGESMPRPQHASLSQASLYADSVYFSNVDGNYSRSMRFADSCRYYLNRYYLELNPYSADTLLALGDLSVTPPDIRWYTDSIPLNFNIILKVRNESAVAALALHQWTDYSYNNRIYTQLYKEMSADATLEDYCRAMGRTQANITTAIVLLVMLLLLIIAAVVWQVVASLKRRTERQQAYQSKLEMMEDDIARLSMEEGNLHASNAVLDNCLSTLKHETMYYPSRIQQLAAHPLKTDDHSNAPADGTAVPSVALSTRQPTPDYQSLADVVAYYRELYGILSQQALRQTERAKLHLVPLSPPYTAPSYDGPRILGDRNLIGYLFEILRKQSGERSTFNVQCSPVNDKYVEVRVSMPQLHLTEHEASQLFMPRADHIPYLLCRQIVREHGEATGRRGCGIWAELINQTTTIIILLPLCKTSKSSS